MRKRDVLNATKLLLPLMVLSVLAVLVSACSGSDSESVDQLESEIAVTTQSAQRAQVLAALEPLDPLRYHHHDSTIRNDGRIPAEAVIWATRARETLDWVDWPIELEAHVEQYADWLDSLLGAMRNNDAQAASDPSRITHALAHTFEAVLEAWLNNESLPAVPELAGLEPPSHIGHDSEDDQGSMSHDQMQSEDEDSDSMSHEQHDADQDSEMSEDHDDHDEEQDDSEEDHDGHDD